jgi:hypothetical protein
MEIDGRAIYGGVIGPHFGHSITQSLGRLWATTKNLDEEILFISQDPNLKKIPQYFIDLLKKFGVLNPVRLLTSSARVRELVLADDLCNLDRRPCVTSFFKEWLSHQRPVAQVDENLSVYVSRSKLPLHHGQFLQETILENALKRCGYVIMHPELLSLSEQVDLYLRAQHIILADGSAAHLWSLLAQSTQNVAIVLRRPPNRHMKRWFKAMSFPEPKLLDFVCADFYRSRGDDTKSVAMLDMSNLWKSLRDEGFHSSDEEIGMSRLEIDEQINLYGSGVAPSDRPRSRKLDRRTRHLLNSRPNAVRR